MTQEEKALAYDEALRRARDYYEDKNCFEYLKGVLEHIFYELKKPDDEEIRKTLLETFSNFNAAGTFWSDILRISKDNVIAWLKKQGEQKRVDKVEPKFHEGDWVIWKNNTYLITANKYRYDTIDQKGYETEFEFETFDNDGRLWGIKDAKEGDVLFCKGELKYSNGIKYERICLFNNLDKAFFTLTKASNYVEEYDIDVNIDYPDNTVPATKEQRDILFMAMTDAEYTFDFEKKELRKIEQKIKWNKEDEEILMHVIQDVELLLGDEDERYKDERRQSLVWLKSLKQKMEWKPTKEQMKALHDLNLVGNISHVEQGQLLIELYNDLKKLIE